MKKISESIDENLAHLAWSLWSELGVAGIERNHRDFPISVEELIILTSTLSDFDPRLRDEALDWCCKYHEFISPIRLEILAKKYHTLIEIPFSIFSSTFNTITHLRTQWIVLKKVAPLKISLSEKSQIRNFNAPSMLQFRLRSLFGLGARADLLEFLLNEKKLEFSSSDLLVTGYSKRRIAIILNELALSGILSEKKVRNQLNYTFSKKNEFIKLIGEIPKKQIHWDQILAVLLPIRNCLQKVEEAPIGIRVVDIRNLLFDLREDLLELQLTPPELEKDFEAYWKNFEKWMLDFTQSLRYGKTIVFMGLGHL